MNNKIIDSQLKCKLLHRPGIDTKQANNTDSQNGSKQITKDEFCGFLLQCVKGEILMKFGCRQSFQRKRVYISPDLSRLCWQDEFKTTSVKSFSFSLCGCVKQGVDNFLSKKKILRRAENDKLFKERIFSIYCSALRDPICIECHTVEQCKRWIIVLNICVHMTKLKTKTSEWFCLKSEWDFNPPKSPKEIRSFLQKSNIGITKREITTISDKLKLESNKCSLSFEEFFEVHLKLSHHKELQSLFEKYSKPSKENASVRIMSVEDFSFFLLQEQHEFISREEIRKLMASVLQRRREETGRNGTSLIFTESDFENYLSSSSNFLVDDALYSNSMDMTQSLPNYFISTSHNTYLENNQYKGKSSVQMYIQALKSGCRCVEIDCWDGTSGEPVVYHGYTLTQKISFSEVVKAIKDYAFVTSAFPLLISLENHCSIKQQNKLALIFTDVLGRENIALRSQYDPKKVSPEKLKNKILIKGAMHNTSENLQKLIFLRCEKFKKTMIPQITSSSSVFSADNHCEIRSSSEKNLQRIRSADIKKFVKYMRYHLLRFYPGYNRMNSSNFNPATAWALSCQMAAMNFQTLDKGKLFHDGMFAMNGGCGYVLKPDCLRRKNKRKLKKTEKETIRLKCGEKAMDEEEPISSSWASDDEKGQNNIAFVRSDNLLTVANQSKIPPLNKTKSETLKEIGVDSVVKSPKSMITLRLTVISASQLPKAKDNAETNKVVSPFVQIDLCGLNKYKVKTKTITENGFNPIWEEEFKFPLGKLEKETSMILFRVFDASSLKNKMLLGSNALCICYLKKGYRFVPLKNRYNEVINRCGLYCLIKFEN